MKEPGLNPNFDALFPYNNKIDIEKITEKNFEIKKIEEEITSIAPKYNKLLRIRNLETNLSQEITLQKLNNIGNFPFSPTENRPNPLSSVSYNYSVSQKTSHGSTLSPGSYPQTPHSMTGSKESDERLVNVSIAFSEVLQLQVRNIEQKSMRKKIEIWTQNPVIVC